MKERRKEKVFLFFSVVFCEQKKKEKEKL